MSFLAFSEITQSITQLHNPYLSNGGSSKLSNEPGIEAISISHSFVADVNLSVLKKNNPTSDPPPFHSTKSKQQNV